MKNSSALKASLMLTAITLLLAAVPASGQTCGPLNDGRFADTFHEGTVIYWQPFLEYDKIVLTITGPCEDIVREFGPKDQPFFDIREIERIVDGQYSWTLQRIAPIDSGVQKELQAARGSGKEDALWWDYFQSGKLPAGPFTDAGSFSVVRGQIIDPTSGEEKSLIAKGELAGELSPIAFGGATDASALQTKAVVLTNSDGVIRNSLCVGFDCPNNPTFSDSTIILTENNTRIKFDDTSTSSSFPRNDWEIKANSTNNGGRSWLGFTDCGQSNGGGCADDHVFGVEAGAPAHALWVDPGGDVGFGTLTPILDLHAVDGDTPALRLEQNTSSGFGAQTWDIAGNETSFFIRDATNGSTLPFRIRPGAASNRLVIDADGEIGIGTLNPAADLEIEGSAAPEVRLDNTSTNGESWSFISSDAGNFVVSAIGSGATELRLAPTTGDLTIAGSLHANGGANTFPDFVFAPDYPLMSLGELASFIRENGHLPRIPSAGEVEAKGSFNMTELQLRLLEKVEELTLYTLDQQSTIDGLESRNDDLLARLVELEARLGSAD